MATFEEQVELLAGFSINATSIPVNEVQLSQLLVDGLIDCVNKIIQVNPKELSKFTKTTNAVDSVTKKGTVLSVLREHNSESILRICTPINPSLRYEATDVESLHYRSKYNPGYYEKDGQVICVPEASGSGHNDIVVTQVHYDTGLINLDEYNAGNIENFPLEYEYLVALHAASSVCKALALNIHDNLPNKPLEPEAPIFSSDNDSLPEIPSYFPPEVQFNYTAITKALGQQDLDLSEKYLNILDKKLEEWGKKSEIESNHFNKELEVFKASLEKSIKDFDRRAQVEAGEYRSKILKYQYDITDYQAKLSEEIAQYKWYMEESMRLMMQYNEGIFKVPMQKAKQAKQEKRQQPKQQTQQEGY